MSEAPPGTRDAERRPPDHVVDHDEQPALQLTRRNLLGIVAFLAASLAALYFLLPQLAGLDETWARIERGRPAWMVAALVFTCGMFGGYVAMFRGIFAGASARIDWAASYQITMAGLAASRLFAAGGAGGLVLQAWALRRAGVEKRAVADKTMAFLVLTYFPYAAAVVVCGFGLHWGLFRGQDPFAFTFVPAVIALVAMALCLALAVVPTDLQRRVGSFTGGQGRVMRLLQQLAQVPAATSAGVREALAHLRSRDPALLGAVLFWAFQIAVLWAAFHAFGAAPPLAVLTQAFFVGMLGNLLPMPGGVGGVEGGMIAAFVAFGVSGGLAVVAVLVFRAFTFWLPMVPGVIAYFQLRRTVERWRHAWAPATA
ncbi:MAG TPA: lysylphosphatidylglycerol synthase transmembrane domain-containing protein [Solirubrobacteraceae bacterium]|nr:lysylphosphatidylglycerol synthase transmembrane domain-containing protein [Solirubrobacteraceae bacterium]